MQSGKSQMHQVALGAASHVAKTGMEREIMRLWGRMGCQIAWGVVRSFHTHC